LAGLQEPADASDGSGTWLAPFAKVEDETRISHDFAAKPGRRDVADT